MSVNTHLAYCLINFSCKLALPFLLANKLRICSILLKISQLQSTQYLITFILQISINYAIHKMLLHEIHVAATGFL